MNKKMIAVLLAVVAVSMPCLAAETLTITNLNYVDYSKIVSIKSNLYTGSLYAGGLVLTTNEGTLYGFCIDMYDHSNTGVFEKSSLEHAALSVNNPNGPMSSAKADNVRRLYDVAYYNYVLPEMETKDC